MPCNLIRPAVHVTAGGPGAKVRSEFSHKKWLPRVPRIWAPGISMPCRVALPVFWKR